MNLYVARWPDGTAWLVRADCMEDVAGLLDEVADPGACEVELYDGPLLVEFQPGKRPADEEGHVTFHPTEAETQGEVAEALLAAAFPGLYQLVEEHGWDVSDAKWRAALTKESRRKLDPSEEWSRAVASWWEGFSNAPADRTAVLRRLMRVTIPGEPQPETPEQERVFREAERRVMERVSKVFAPTVADGPKHPTKPRGPKRPRKKKGT